MGTTADGKVGGSEPPVTIVDGAGSGTPGGEGTDSGATGASGTPAAVPGSGGLDRTKLPTILQGMNEEQIGETFNTLFNAVRSPVERTVEAPPPPKRLSADELKERFDTTSDKFDPRSAITELVNENYGGLITDISKKANEGMKTSFRTNIPDFKEHEADIDKVLQGIDPNLVSQQVMLDAYLRVVGAKSLKVKIGEATRPPTTHSPTPRKEEQDEKLSEEEINVAKVMFRGAADPIAEFRKASKMMGESGVSVKVPGEAK